MTGDKLLLIIDAQYDFCDPNGALYVEGAEGDILNICGFIREYGNAIDEIVLTQDVHHVLDISHPGFWMDASGHSPAPFTTVTLEAIKTGKWQPKFEASRVLQYIEQLELQGEYPHVIWPEHCIIGSYGAAIVNALMRELQVWARKGHYFQVVQKGLHPLTEHFGALRANIPVEEDPGTLMNETLKTKLLEAETIMVCGEARSHCVANTIRQMSEIHGILEKTILLDDATSNVKGFENIGLSIYENAVMEGLQIKSTNTVFV
jgi:nicotinamidase-related amidase